MIIADASIDVGSTSRPVIEAPLLVGTASLEQIILVASELADGSRFRSMIMLREVHIDRVQVTRDTGTYCLCGCLIRRKKGDAYRVRTQIAATSVP